MLETAWAARVRANREQVDRVREVPDGADFYAPVTGSSGRIPRRTDEPALEIPAGARPAGRDVAGHRGGSGPVRPADRGRAGASGGEVIAVDPSMGMLDALRELADRARDRERPRRPGALATRRRRAVPRRRRADRARRLRHRGDRPVPRGDGGGHEPAVRGDPDGTPARVGRRRVLAAGPRRGARRPAGPPRVRRAAPRARARPGRRAAGARDPSVRRSRRSSRASSVASSGSSPAATKDRPLPGRARRSARGRCRRGWSACVTNAPCPSGS